MHDQPAVRERAWRQKHIERVRLPDGGCMTVNRYDREAIRAAVRDGMPPLEAYERFGTF